MVDPTKKTSMVMVFFQSVFIQNVLLRNVPDLQSVPDLRVFLALRVYYITDSLNLQFYS